MTWVKLKCDKCGADANAKYNDSVVSRESITSVLCKSCAISSSQLENALRARLSLAEKLAEAANRVIESAKPYKAGGFPLQEKVATWTKAMEDMETALRAYDAGKEG